MINQELLLLAQGLANNLTQLKSLKGAKFTYGITKNMDLIQKEMDLINDIIKPSDELKKYDDARVKICEEFAKKDENGEFIKLEIAPGSGQYQYDIDEESQEWIDALGKIKNEYSSILQERDEQINEYNKLLNTEITIDFYKIKLDDVPTDISLELMQIIKPFIVE